MTMEGQQPAKNGDFKSFHRDTDDAQCMCLNRHVLVDQKVELTVR